MRQPYLSTLTRDEIIASQRAAQEERERIIQEAIDNGAKVNYVNSKISQDEMETHIRINYEGECVIDTTLSRDIVKCIKNGWKITSITYYKDTKQVVGMTFIGNTSNLTIRKI